jgi:predicted glycosyltransferase
MNRPRLLFYCQHSLGLGHLARSLLLAESLSAAFDVILLNGGRFPAGTRIPPGVTVLQLTPLGHDAAHKLVTFDSAVSLEDVKRTRRRQLLETLEQVDPAVLLLELYPFGRRKFEFELVPLLEAVPAGGHRPRVVCSLRDILVGRENMTEHDERVVQRANASLDAVLVHSDPSFARLEESFHPRTPLRVPVHYTGFVAPPTPAAAVSAQSSPPLRRLLVSSGGGMVGEPLVRAAVGASADLAATTGLTTTIVAGPFLPEPVWTWLQEQAAASPVLEAVRRVDDLAGEIRRSSVSLSQAGYNTCMDLLRASTPAVVVPYAEGGEDEQTRRAERLADLGLLKVLPASSLESTVLRDALRDALDAPPSPVRLDLDGAEHTTRLLLQIATNPSVVGMPESDGSIPESDVSIPESVA